jgi:hypothetical protein
LAHVPDVFRQNDAESARKELQQALRAVSQRRAAIIQGADDIMKVSNEAAKEFDKSVLATMLKAAQLCISSTLSLRFVLVFACFHHRSNR